MNRPQECRSTALYADRNQWCGKSHLHLQLYIPALSPSCVVGGELAQPKNNPEEKIRLAFYFAWAPWRDLVFGHRVSAEGNVGTCHQDDRRQDPSHPGWGLLMLLGTQSFKSVPNVSCAGQGELRSHSSPCSLCPHPTNTTPEVQNFQGRFWLLGLTR